MTKEEFYQLEEAAFILFYQQVICRNTDNQYYLAFNETNQIPFNSKNSLHEADIILFLFDCNKQLNAHFGSNYPFRDPNFFFIKLNIFNVANKPKIFNVVIKSKIFWFLIQDNEEITPETRTQLETYLTILPTADVELAKQATKLSDEYEIQLFKYKFNNELMRLNPIQINQPPILVNTNATFFKKENNQSAGEKFHELLTPVSYAIFFGGIALGLILALGALAFSMHGMAAATIACAIAASIVTFLAPTLPLIGLGVDAALNPHHYNRLG